EYANPQAHYGLVGGRWTLSRHDTSWELCPQPGVRSTTTGTMTGSGTFGKHERESGLNIDGGTYKAALLIQPTHVELNEEECEGKKPASGGDVPQMPQWSGKATGSGDPLVLELSTKVENAPGIWTTTDTGVATGVIDRLKADAGGPYTVERGATLALDGRK